MYRRYRQRQSDNGLPVRPFSVAAYLAGDGCSSTASSRPVSAMSLNQLDLALDVERITFDRDVIRCWKCIEEQCRNISQHPRALSLDGHLKHGWQTVRIFVSSTFTDFHNEREILVKKVIIVNLRLVCVYTRNMFYGRTLHMQVQRYTAIHILSICIDANL